MKFLKALVLVACCSSFAEADNRIKISDYKSDYLCFFNDPDGFHSDEGFAVSIHFDACVDVLFVEEPFVKYSLDCELDIASSNQTIDVQCTYPFSPQTTLSLSIDKQTLKAHANIGGDAPESLDLNCRRNL